MHAQTLTVRPLVASDLPAAAALSGAEGWPHTPDDWAAFLDISTGYAIADETGLVATTMATPFGPDTTTLNMIIVRRDRRGRGLARRIVEVAMAQAGGRELRLIATAEGLPLYRKLGFETTGEIAQHQAVLAQPAGVPGEADGIVWGGAADIDTVAALDAAAYGADRSALIAQIAGRGRIALAAGEAGRPTGFALRRAFGRGEVVGPVVAPDLATAERLVAAHLGECAGRFVRVDATAECGLGAFLARSGLPHVGGGTAMVRAPRPADTARPVTTFAIARQAFG